MENILDTIPKTVTVAAYVYKKEALSIYTGPEQDVRQSKVGIELQPFVNAGLLKIVDIASKAEIELQVNLEAKLDPGEAISGAIAINRNWAIGVDEKKARNLFSREAAHIQQLYTLELVKHWIDTQNPSPETILIALKNIRYRAIYKPGRNHPLYDWWITYLPEFE
jgi:hypothetical protein